jgi:hypothetical protein
MALSFSKVGVTHDASKVQRRYQNQDHRHSKELLTNVSVTDRPKISLVRALCLVQSFDNNKVDDNDNYNNNNKDSQAVGRDLIF